MYGAPIEKNGLDITVKPKNRRFVLRLIIAIFLVFSTAFLYSSYGNPSQDVTAIFQADHLAHEEVSIAPSFPTNVAEEIDRRFIIEDKRDDNKDSKDDNKDSKDENKDSNDNNNSDNKDDESDSKKKSTPIYNQPGMRFVFALFGFILLNMFAICIHHIYMKASNSIHAYKNVDDDISPF